MSHWFPPVTLQIALRVANLSHHTHTYISICYIYIYTHIQIRWNSLKPYLCFCYFSFVLFKKYYNISSLTPYLSPNDTRDSPTPTHNPHVESGWRPTLSRCWFRVETIIYIYNSLTWHFYSHYICHTSRLFSSRPTNNSKLTIYSDLTLPLRHLKAIFI